MLVLALEWSKEMDDARLESRALPALDCAYGDMLYGDSQHFVREWPGFATLHFQQFYPCEHPDVIEAIASYVEGRESLHGLYRRPMMKLGTTKKECENIQMVGYHQLDGELAKAVGVLLPSLNLSWFPVTTTTTTSPNKEIIYAQQQRLLDKYRGRYDLIEKVLDHATSCAHESGMPLSSGYTIEAIRGIHVPLLPEYFPDLPHVEDLLSQRVDAKAEHMFETVYAGVRETSGFGFLPWSVFGYAPFPGPNSLAHQLFETRFDMNYAKMVAKRYGPFLARRVGLKRVTQPNDVSPSSRIELVQGGRPSSASTSTGFSTA
jgi:hypothetical protein